MAKIDIDASKVEFKIDEEFAGYLFPLTNVEYEQLKKSIKREGCREPLIIWDEKNILVDGHHRLSICQEIGKGYDIERKSFQFRAQVIAWIITNQFAQRNLNNQAKDFYLGELYKDEKKEAKRPKKGSELGSLTAEKIAKEERGIGPSAIIHNQDYAKAVNKVTKNVGNKFRKIAVYKEKLSKSATKKMPLLDKSTQKEVLDIIESSDKSFTKREIETLSNIGKDKKKKVLNKIKDGKSDDIDIALKKIEKEEKKKEFTKKAKEFDKTSNKVQIYQGDFQKIASDKIKDNSIDHIITDPPYPGEFLPEWSKLSKVASRVLKPGGFCISYSGKYHLPEVISHLSENLEYYWQLILLHQGSSAGIYPRNINTGYKPILVFAKPPINKQEEFITDIIEGTGKEKDLHEWQQGEEELKQVLNRFTDPNDLILDPFAGSGTIPYSCLKNNRRSIAIEKDDDTYETLKGRVADILSDKK